VVQYAVILVTLHPRLARALAGSLACAAAAALATTFVAGAIAPARADGMLVDRAFRPWHALGLLVVVCLVSIAAAWLKTWLGDAGLVLVSAVAGLLDAHSTAGSVAALYRGGSIELGTAQLAILGALSANSLTKLVMAWSGRHVRFGLAVTAGILLVAASAWLGLWLS
jgi:uncharacterized membrane protein (DUF4010 family)